MQVYMCVCMCMFVHQWLHQRKMVRKALGDALASSSAQHVEAWFLGSARHVCNVCNMKISCISWYIMPSFCIFCAGWNMSIDVSFGGFGGLWIKLIKSRWSMIQCDKHDKPINSDWMFCLKPAIPPGAKNYAWSHFGLGQIHPQNISKMKSFKTVAREISPDLHLIMPELHLVSPDFFFKKLGKCKMQFHFPVI